MTRHHVRATVAFVLTTLFCQAASACLPPPYQAYGFDTQPSSDSAAMRLPANARGAIFSDARGAESHAPMSSELSLEDVTAGKSVIPSITSTEPGRYFIRPQGGFVEGHTYVMTATGVTREQGSPYVPSIRVTVGPPLSVEALRRSLRVVTGNLAMLKVGSKAAPYADRVHREMRVRTRTLEFPTDCGFTPQAVAPPSGCHVVDGSAWMPEVSDRTVQKSAMVCGRWLAVPWFGNN